MDAEVWPRLAGRAGPYRGVDLAPTLLGAAMDLAASRTLAFDAGLRLVEANRAMREWAGWAVEVPVGVSLGALFGDPAQTRALARTVLSEGRWVGRLRLIPVGSPPPEEEWSATMARGHAGEVVLLLTASRDDDGRGQHQRTVRAQRLEALGQLSAGISHDFNNVLTAIAGYAAFARDATEDGSRLAEDLDQVLLAAGRGSALVAQLVAFSRRQAMRAAEVNVNDVLTGVAPMLGRLIGESVELGLALEPGLGTVLADSGQLEQVLVNLATNARDAMPRGGRLTVETAAVELAPEYAAAHPGARPGPHVVIAVSDTGIGMSAETLAHVFEPFFTTKGPDLGTGLGLATVHGIVGQLGGHVWAYSEPGLGTTFKIYLPTASATADPPQRGPASAPSPGEPSGAPGIPSTVLVVEDAAPIRDLVVRILGGAGYRVLSDASPGDTLRRPPAELASVDLLVTDMVMPDMSGPELAAILLDRVPGLRVICMSGYSDQSAVQHGLGADVSDFLPKPFQAEALVAAVGGLLGRRR